MNGVRLVTTMAKRRTNPDDCPICGQAIDIVVRCFSHTVFYDGKKYNEICFTCASVVKFHHLANPNEEDDSKIEWLRFSNEPGIGPIYFKTVEEMVEEGWNSPEEKKQAKKSIRAVKTACRKRKIPVGRVNTFREK
jgi:hypothetical protein